MTQNEGMLSYKMVIRLSVALGIITWLLLLLLDMMALFSAKNNIAFGLPHFAPQVAFGLFIVCLIVYYRYRINKAESVNFIDLLWRVFLTGLLTTIVSLAIKLLFTVLDSTNFAGNQMVINFFYHINLGLILAFAVSTVIVWKRLILYQKTKSLLNLWSVFEYLLIGALFFDMLGYKLFDPLFNAYLIVLMVVGLLLSFNLKWVAYLNFKQKWKSILFIILVVIYLLYFLDGLVNYSNRGLLVTDLLDSVYVIASFGFIFTYSIISILVILFNLPTSSVFEKKLEEAINFQRLSQTLPTGQKQDQIYRILLDSTISAVFADAAWIEMKTEGKKPEQINYNIEERDVESIKKAIKSNALKKVLDGDVDQLTGPQKYSSNLKGVKFRSILLFPIITKQKQIGSIALLKDVGDGFNREMVDIISTFVNQASISLENLQLINEALVNERYKEELAIASKVQKSILPDHLEGNSAYEIIGVSMAANEVGGDYYDSYKLSETRFGLIIADVSGKGTSAAFNMSQMKGIFHSLVQLDLDPLRFMVLANDALSRCLERSSFITASYFNIDTETRKLSFTRAGHCPTLFFDESEKQINYITNKGLGLGILRNASFKNYVEVNELTYNTGDILLLYTDGVTEACTTTGEQFGYERLANSLLKYSHLNPEGIKKGVFDDLYAFCERNLIDDDYSMLIVKFN
uniref:GAF domain-containing SpoIIE family protein phosphatase n=1 Tax=Fulvivirga sp. TaxID=1931237 RepID=UPI004049B341